MAGTVRGVPIPRIGITHVGGTEGDGVELELRSAIEPWHVLGDDSSSGAAARYVDSSTERLQVSVRNFEPARHLLACNGSPVPLVAAGTPGYYVAGVRYKAWKPWSSLHPTIDLDTPLRFDLIDRASQLSLGGATYHVVHPWWTFVRHTAGERQGGRGTPRAGSRREATPPA